jgi:hypothetical protein
MSTNNKASGGPKPGTTNTPPTSGWRNWIPATPLYAAWLIALSATGTQAAVTFLTMEGGFVQTAWELPGAKVEFPFDTYHGYPIPDGHTPPYPTLTIGGVTFQGGRLSFGISRFDRYFLWNDGFEVGAPLTIHFTKGARAFGAYVSCNPPPEYTSYTGKVTVDNNESFTFTAPTALYTPLEYSQQFVGIVSTTTFTNLTFYDQVRHEEWLFACRMVLDELPPVPLTITATNAALPDTIDLWWPAATPAVEVQQNTTLDPANWVTLNVQTGVYPWNPTNRTARLPKPQRPTYYRLALPRWL